ncbi:FAD-dependent oxidoreductase [Candidatus Shapirobacteria bacterium]|nr:FAD-dependent oxidoreductase [Candidatus Shapirobacteria bacterium]
MAKISSYDLIIIGAGPAGLAASIYASRYRIKHLVLGQQPGGTITLAHKVENYPGFLSISGPQLGQKFMEHAKGLGAEIEIKEVVEIKKKKNCFLIITNNNGRYKAKAIIIATGTKRKSLGIPGEDIYLGHGVSYCATCDAAFYKGKIVAVVGGANAACSGALHLARFAKKVYLVYRGKSLRAEPAWVDEARENPKIEIIFNTNPAAILGDGKKVTAIALDKTHGGQKKLGVDGVFIEVGGVPVVSLAKNLGVETDEDNYLLTDNFMATNIPGIFAAGDINSFQKNCQQVVTAVAEGAQAALGVYQYLSSQKREEALKPKTTRRSKAPLH